jgi:hypothetical protein
MKAVTVEWAALVAVAVASTLRRAVTPINLAAVAPAVAVAQW